MSQPLHFEKEDNIPFSLSPSTLGVHQDQQGVGTRGGDDLILQKVKEKEISSFLAKRTNEMRVDAKKASRKGGWEAVPGMEDRKLGGRSLSTG